MLKLNYSTLITVGLIALTLAACSGAEVSQLAPAEAAKPAEAEMAAPESSMAEKPAVVVEEVAPEAEEAMDEAVEPASEETMAKPAEMTSTDEAMMAEADKATITEETMAKTEEIAPSAEEDEVMVEESLAPADEVAMVEAAETEAMQPAESIPAPGLTEAQQQLLAGLENQGMPPELFNETWLNSNPLKLADLHGKVVIVEFWTFGCYNCKNVVPSLRAWHKEYNDDGLVIIGVHTPEFGYEREVANVQQALLDQDIPYAVAIDNDWQTWRAYNNRYWPAKYFVDKAGNLRHIHIGEGGYEQQEEIIEALLAESLS